MLTAGGITPFTATDYPGKLAAVVFVQGCPWRCGYCHNPHLQQRLPHSPLHWSRIRRLLQRRAGLLDAVVFSGGEPTLDPGLGDAIAEVRKMGFQVGLHSGGIYPERLAEVLPLLDWIGLDIKAPFDERYDRITQTPGSAARALVSARTVLASGIAYEFRTTVHPALLSAEDILELARSLGVMGVTEYALQAFRAQGCDHKELKSAMVTAYPPQDVVMKIAALFPRFTLRNN